MSNRERLEALIDYYSEGNKSMFGRLIGLQPSSITNWIRRDTLDFELIYSKCANLNPHWLLTGEGEMIIGVDTDIQKTYTKQPQGDTIEALISAIQKQARELGSLQFQLEEEQRKHSETKKELDYLQRGIDTERLKTVGDVTLEESARAV